MSCWDSAQPHAAVPAQEHCGCFCMEMASGRTWSKAWQILLSQIYSFPGTDLLVYQTQAALCTSSLGVWAFPGFVGKMLPPFFVSPFYSAKQLMVLSAGPACSAMQNWIPFSSQAAAVAFFHRLDFHLWLPYFSHLSKQETTETTQGWFAPGWWLWAWAAHMVITPGLGCRPWYAKTYACKWKTETL